MSDGCQKIRHVGDYRKMREPMYPSLKEFADAYYHMSRGNPGPMAAYLSKCDEVKTKVPKLKREVDHDDQ